MRALAGMLHEGTHGESQFYPGTNRRYWVYVPAQYDGRSEAALMVFQDGEAYVREDGWFRAPRVMDDLIERGEMPVTIGLFVNAGHHGEHLPDRCWIADNRSREYDTMGDLYAGFLIDELLPTALVGLRVSLDPEKRAVVGFSSGGTCSFTIAWNRFDAFRKVVSHCGSFANIRGGHQYPFMIRQTAKRPLRVFLQSGEGDVDNEMGNWFLCNRQMESALRYRGYDVMADWEGKGHDGRRGGELLPETLRWLWREDDR